MDDVYNVNQLMDLDRSSLANGLRLTITPSNFLGNQVLYAIRTCLLSIKPGGSLVINGTALQRSVVLKSNGGISRQLLTGLVAIAIDEFGDIAEVSESGSQIVVNRNEFESKNEWSAGVVFSGSESEVEQLQKCLEGLAMQPELSGPNKIFVVGPKSAQTITAWPSFVRYLPYDEDVESRGFLIGRKKNALVRKLETDKVLVCHARMVLQPDCLKNLPLEFDVITPSVLIRGRKALLNYLDMGFLKLPSVPITSPHDPIPIFYPRTKWMSYLRHYMPYIDGGCFAVRAELIRRIPIHNDLVWGEGEDVEWSRRLLMSGKITEISVSSFAISQTDKTRLYGRWGHTVLYRFAFNIHTFILKRLFVLVKNLKA